jgi:hypothetical protein
LSSFLILNLIFREDCLKGVPDHLRIFLIFREETWCRWFISKRYPWLFGEDLCDKKEAERGSHEISEKEL